MLNLLKNFNREKIFWIKSKFKFNNYYRYNHKNNLNCNKDNTEYNYKYNKTDLHYFNYKIKSLNQFKILKKYIKKVKLFQNLKQVNKIELNKFNNWKD